VQTANQCAAADITAYVTACGATQTTTSCNTWLAANVAVFSSADAAVSTTCGACIYPTDSSGNFTNAGPIYNTTLPGMYVASTANTGGCVQLMDPDGGAPCALAQASRPLRIRRQRHDGGRHLFDIAGRIGDAIDAISEMIRDPSGWRRNHR